jgi:hypothetical protein
MDSAELQLTCDQTKNWLAVLVGADAPKLVDEDATFAGMGARVSKTIDHLLEISPSAFEGAADRSIVFPLQGDLVLDLDGAKFLGNWMLPQLYFHVVVAYGILRHQGVDLGIRDYMTHLGPSIRSK